jgi:hypothetical protein
MSRIPKALQVEHEQARAALDSLREARQRVATGKLALQISAVAADTKASEAERRKSERILAQALNSPTPQPTAGVADDDALSLAIEARALHAAIEHADARMQQVDNEIAAARDVVAEVRGRIAVHELEAAASAHDKALAAYLPLLATYLDAAASAHGRQAAQMPDLHAALARYERAQATGEVQT